MDLKQFISSLGDKNVTVNLQQKNKNGENKIEGNQFARTIINIQIDPSNPMQFHELIELSTTEVSPEIKEKVLPIEKLISDGKNSLALEQYTTLFNGDDFQSYSKSEKFLVYNGILNCHVNLNSYDSEIEKWSIKIEALGDVADVHKYYYIKAIWKYNNGDLKVSKALNDKAISKDGNYTNALSFDILLKARMNEISYEYAIRGLKSILDGDLPAKDISRTYGILADVSFMNEKYNESLEFYKESNEYAKGFGKELGIAVSLYHLSIKEIRPDGMVDFKNIDFETLKKSLALLEKTYEEKSEDFIGHSANVLISYLFNIYSLIGKFDKTLKIIEDVRDILDFENPDITRLVVQAQVINNIYDEEVFSHLNEYEEIKYRSFYLELCGEYKQVYNILLPAIEGKYSSDKLLRLSFMNCLQRLDNFSDYLKYYKKFLKDEVDEALLMNFIEYLEELGKTTEMIVELKKLKACLSNPFIAVAYMKTLLRNEFYDELDDFYESVDKGIYPIIEDNRSMVTNDRVMSYLKREDYTLFYSSYEKLDLAKLRDADRLILTVNYYNAKGDYPSCGKSYFQLYELEKNQNVLMKAIQNMIIANESAVAEMYLEYVNPMELEQPEIYYIYSAMVLRERKKLDEAFDKLDEYKDFVEDLDSPFHQFYFGFNMSNGRTEEAMKYVDKYYTKNPNPKWFKIITHEENESGEEILNKLKSLTGPTPDYEEINKYYSAGLLGVTVYSVVTNRRFEDILYDNRYPLYKLNITNENVEVSIKKAESISDSLIIDANTLIVLSKINGLELLNAFSKIYISQDTHLRLKGMERELFKNISTKILEYIDLSLNVEILPVDIRIKDTSTRAARLLPDDTMSSLALSESMGIAFLNTEISLVQEFKPNYTVNINTFFFKLRTSNPELAEKIAVVKRDLRQARFNFISFESSDIINVYKLEGIDGIKPFVKLDMNSIYNTFLPQYMTVLIELQKELEREDFKELLAYFINYFDRYIGKSKYYLFNLARRFVTLENDVKSVISHCNIRRIFWFLKKANLSEVWLDLFRKLVGEVTPIEDLVYTHNLIEKHDKGNSLDEMRKSSYEMIQAVEYTEALRDSDYIKVSHILSFVAQFFTQVLSAFGTTEENKRHTLQIIEKNINVNSIEDIYYLIELIKEVQEKDNG